MTDQNRANRTPADTQWVDDFTVEMRLRDATGPAIGDHLAHAESFAHESGQSLTQAFGSGADYARSLELSASEREPQEPLWKSVIGSLLGCVGLFLVPTALPALPAGPVPFSWGTLVLIAIVGVCMLLIPRALRWIIEHTLLAVLAFAALSVVMVFVALKLTATAVTLPAWLPLILGLASLAASVVFNRRVMTEDTAVRDPLTGEDRFEARSTRIMATLFPWLFVIVAAFNAAIVLALG